MGNSCSSGQAHKDKDNMSQRSEESGSYHVRTSLPSEKQQVLLNHVSQQHSGVLLEPSTAGQPSLQSAPPGTTAPPTSFTTNEKKPVLSKVLRGVATSSISADSMSLSSPPGVHSPKGFDQSHVPKEVSSLSEDLQNFIMGRVADACCNLFLGNCRWSLCGHTAPVSSLRLDPTGALCLSSDSEGRDRSIRVWDLNKGNLVAVYTPECNITACEIMSGGKHIVLALEGRHNLLTLQLRGPDIDTHNADEVYGAPENNGKIFELKESDYC